MDGQRLSRRRFLTVAGVGASSLALAACAPQVVTQQVEVTREVEKEVQVEVTREVEKEVEKEVQVEVTAAAEAKTLSVLWGNWGEVFNNLMMEIGKSYTEQNPNVTLEWEFADQWMEKLLTSVAGGTPPDVTYVNIEQSTNLAFQGAFLPLDAFVVLTGMKREDFVIPMWDASVWDGKLYSVPGGADFYGVFWNKSLYEDAGLDPEKPPKTAAELVDHSLKVLKKDANGLIERMGWTPNTWADPLWMWGYLFGGRWYDEGAQKITADDPKNVETLKWMKTYTDELDPDQLEAFNSSLPDFWSPGNSFASKKTALRFDGFWTYDPLDQYAPDIDYGVALFPTVNGTEEEKQNWGVIGWTVAIPAGVNEAAASWDFLKYGFIDNSWKMGCDTLNGCVVLDQMPQFEECVTGKLGPDNRMTPYFNVFTETGVKATKQFPAIPVNAQYIDELDRAYQYVIRDEKTPEEALAEVTATIQAELDKVMNG
jgi:multiple sugar transport system substrate-binding protein